MNNIGEKEVYKLLKKSFDNKADYYFMQLEKFVNLLWEENQKVNLISRKMVKEEYWTKHILDSLQIIGIESFNKKKILDFGSGGGLPGIPIKLLFPSSEMYLLDSKFKKMRVIEKIVKVLDLKSCFTIVSRIEEIDKSWFDKFDCLLCRSVRIESRYKENMLKLLKKNGNIFLYKGQKMDDVKFFSNWKMHNVNHSLLGDRKIIQIKKEYDKNNCNR